MSSAHVLSIQALVDLKAAFTRFGHEMQEALNATDIELRRTLDWLQERLAYWRNEVRRREQILHQALADLQRCQAQVYYDPETGRTYRPNCSAYEMQVLRARTYLAEAEAELQNVLRWERLVGQAAADYERQAQRLAGQLAHDLPKVTALLSRSAATLYAYAAGSGPGGATISTPLDSAARSTSEVPRSEWTVSGSSAEAEKLRESLERLSSLESGASIAKAIRDTGTIVRFGETSPGAIAHYDSQAGEIVLHPSLADASPAILAAHLAHEGVHVQWREKRDSLDEEYHAFRAQAEVWNRLKGNLRDDQCDWVSGIIALGETRAKWKIAEMYPDLPEYV